MEARADEILHTPTPPSPPARPAEDEDLAAGVVDFARLQLIEKFKPARPDSSPPAREPGPAPRTDSGAPRPDAVAPRPAPLPPPQPRTPTPAARAAPPAGPGKPAPKSAETPLSPTVPPAAEDGPAADDGSLEFTLPPGDLDRVFIDPTVARTQHPGLAGDPQTTRTAPAAEGEAMSGARAHGLDVAEHVRRDVLAGMMQRRFDDSAAPPQSTTAHWAWGAAAALLALLLLFQLLHENREWLAVHAPMRGALRGLYGAMGVSVTTPANLGSYQLRQWGVTGDPNAVGTLRVRASILNTAPQLQPYPLLRVTLANRFGTRIGTRDFEPSEYLGKPTVRMMAPGERADAILDILDPGKDAEGFEIDVCLRGADRQISCTADAAPQAAAPRPKAGS